MQARKGKVVLSSPHHPQLRATHSLPEEGNGVQLRPLNGKPSGEMNVLSSPASTSPSQTSFPLFTPSQNPNPHSKSSCPFPPKSHSLSPPCFAKQQSSSPVLEQAPPPPPERSPRSNGRVPEIDTPDEVLVVRRPVMELPDDEEPDGREGSDEAGEYGSSALDAGLSEFAKKMPMFEPERVSPGSSEEKPLAVNLDLALYRAKVLTRNYKYEEARSILEKVRTVDP